MAAQFIRDVIGQVRCQLSILSYRFVCWYYLWLFLAAHKMDVHVMCLTSSGGLPLFTRKRGSGEPVSIISTIFFKFTYFYVTAFY
jgi:hypothetical protein